MNLYSLELFLVHDPEFIVWVSKDRDETVLKILEGALMHGNKVEQNKNRYDSSRRIILVSALQVVRECLSFEIRRRYAPAAIFHAASIEAAAALAPGLNDLLIVDASHVDSENAAHYLQAAFPDVIIIILMVDRVANLGIAETVHLPPSFDALLFLIGAALGVQPERGANDLPPALTASSEQWKCLTPREQDVAAGVLEGKANKLIAFELGLSDNTVKVHLTQIMRKLKVKNRTQVVLLIGSAPRSRRYEAMQGADAPGN